MTYMHSPDWNKFNGWEIAGEILLIIVSIIFFLPLIIIYIGCLIFGGRP